MLNIIRKFIELRDFVILLFERKIYFPFLNYLNVNFWLLIDPVLVLYLLNVILIFSFFYVFYYYYLIFINFFFRSFFFFLLFLFYYFFYLYYVKNNKLNVNLLKKFFKEHKYINFIGLFIYKWSHFYFWWLEIRIIIINVLRFFRYIFLKLGLEKFFKIIDLFFFFVIFIFIDKMFYLIFIKIFRNFKLKLLSSNLKLLIIARLQGLFFFCLLFILDMPFIFFIKCYIFIKSIELFNDVVNELDIYFNKIYNKFDPIHFFANRFDSSIYTYQMSICSTIFSDRKLLNNLSFSNRLSLYNINFFADKSIILNYNSSIISNNSFIDEYKLTLENMYWYDNNLYFKDILGGLNLIYINNFVFLLKEFILKKVLFEKYLWNGIEGIDILGFDKYNFLLLKLQNILLLLKKFWVLINDNTINNKQKFKFYLFKIFDDIFSDEVTIVSIKLKIIVDNSEICGINNYYGNKQMLNLYNILESEINSWKVMEYDLILQKKLPVNNALDSLNWGLYQCVVDCESSVYFFNCVKEQIDFVVGNNYIEKEIKVIKEN